MTLEDLRDYRNATPFEPFFLVLSDGRKLLVSKPEKIGWHPQGHRLTVYTRGDESDTLEISEVAEVQSGECRKNGRANGR